MDGKLDSLNACHHKVEMHLPSPLLKSHGMLIGKNSSALRAAKATSHVEVSITLGMNSTHRRRIVVRLVYSGETLMTALMTSKEQVERDGLYCCVSEEFVAYLEGIYWYNN